MTPPTRRGWCACLLFRDERCGPREAIALLLEFRFVTPGAVGASPLSQTMGQHQGPGARGRPHSPPPSILSGAAGGGGHSTLIAATHRPHPRPPPLRANARAPSGSMRPPTPANPLPSAQGSRPGLQQARSRCRCPGLAGSRIARGRGLLFSQGAAGRGRASRRTPATLPFLPRHGRRPAPGGDGGHQQRSIRRGAASG